MLAIKNNFDEIMLTLLTQNGCDPKIIDNTGNSPLHVACIKGNLDVVKALISHGADQNSLDIDNDTPITLAVKNGWDKLGSESMAVILILKTHMEDHYYIWH